MNALAPGVAEPLAERFGWWIAFALAACMFATAFLLSLRVREQRTAAATLRPASDGDLLDTLKVARRLFPYIVAMLSCGAAFGASFTFYQPYVLAQGADHVSTFFLGFMLAAVGTRLGLGGVADRVGRRRVAIIALSAYTLMVLAMVQLTPDRLLVFGFGFGLAHGFFFPALNAYALEFTAPHERGRAMTLVNGSFHLGNTASLLSCGYVAHAYGYPMAFALAAAIAGIGVCAIRWDQPLAARLLAVRS
jgi:predicted MFS family arabinose efflux permease